MEKFTYSCMNPIAEVGLNRFNDKYIMVDNAEEADGLLVRSASMHNMEFSDRLLCVARAGAGVNNIPLDKCADKGIVVFNTPGANANGVKELVFAGMLLAARDICGGIQWVNDNCGDDNISKNAESAKKDFAGTELFGKKLGIIGLGAIGVRVANAAKHFGMDVMGYDPYISVDAAWSLSRDIKHVTNIDEIFGECDYITIHVPLMDNTKNTINKDSINKMKNGVIILNFARDLLCDEEAVLEGIKEGKIRKYVSDFPNSVTAGKDGCIVIPHLGASTEESEDNCAVMAVKELKNYLENGNIQNSVNFPNCDMGIPSQKGRIGIFHMNVKGMIAKFSTIFADNEINISDMINKSKGNYAYTLLDIEDEATPDLIESLKNIDNVIRVRVVK